MNTWDLEVKGGHSSPGDTHELLMKYLCSNLAGFAKPVDIYCYRFVQDAHNKMTHLSETRSVSQQASEEGNQMTNQVSSEETQS